MTGCCHFLLSKSVAVCVYLYVLQLFHQHVCDFCSCSTSMFTNFAIVPLACLRFCSCSTSIMMTFAAVPSAYLQLLHYKSLTGAARLVQRWSCMSTTSAHTPTKNPKKTPKKRLLHQSCTMCEGAGELVQLWSSIREVDSSREAGAPHQ